MLGKSIFRSIARQSVRRRQASALQSAEVRVETLQPRLQLSSATWNVEITDGVLFVRDDSDSDNSELRIRVRSDVVQIIDSNAEFHSNVGSLANRHRLEVPLSDITSNRIAVIGDDGDDDLQVETRPNRFVAVSFAGGDGEDNWTVDGSAFDDRFSVFNEPEPGRPFSDYEMRTVDTGFWHGGDLAIAEELRLVAIGSSHEERIEIFDFEANHVATIEDAGQLGRLSVHGDSLFAASRYSGVFRRYSLRTFKQVGEYDTGADYYGSDSAVIGDHLYVSLRPRGGSYLPAQVGRFHLKSGEFEVIDLPDVGLRGYPELIAPDGDPEKLIAATDYRVVVFDVSEAGLSIAAWTSDFQFDQVDVSDDGLRLWGMDKDDRNYNLQELDHELNLVSTVGFSRLRNSLAVSDVDGTLLFLSTLNTSQSTLAVLRSGDVEPFLSIGFPDVGLGRAKADSNAEHVFVVDDDGQFTAIAFPKRAPVLAGTTTFGVGPGVESLTIQAGDGNDVVDLREFTGSGTDIEVDGGGGNDQLTGSERLETLVGGAGEDSLIGMGGDDLLFSQQPNDKMRGRAADGNLVEGPELPAQQGTFPARLYRSSTESLTGSVVVTVDQESTVDLWLDFDGDGRFDGPGDRIVEQSTVLPGQNLLTFDVPTEASAGTLLARMEVTPLSDGGAVAETTVPAVDEFTVLVADADSSGYRVLQVPSFAGDHSILASGTMIKLQTDGVTIATLPAASTRKLLIRGSMARDRLTIESLPGHLRRNVTVKGAAGDDVIVAGSGVSGLRIEGGGGHDVLVGSSGRDTLAGGLGNDSLTGSEGNDVLLGSRGWDSLDGGAGNDKVKGQAAADTLTGGEGNDRLVGNGSLDLVIEAADVDFVLRPKSLFGLGVDRLTGVEAVELTAGDGDNRIDTSRFSGNVVIIGNAGDDTLIGGSGDDVIDAGDGDDVVTGGLGLNTLIGGAGTDDLVELLAGRFRLYPTLLRQREARDLINEVPQADFERAILTGSDGDDEIDAWDFEGPVTINGGAGDDTLKGGRVEDDLSGGPGADTVYGGSGDDLISGGDGPDALVGQSGRDVISGGGGNDFLNGGTDDDMLHGESGDDVIEGGEGRNLVTGGAGIDTLVEDLNGAFQLLEDVLVERDDVTAVRTEFRQDDIEQASLAGGRSNDWIDAEEFGGPVSLYGGRGDDVLIGSAFSDLLFGGSGNDAIEADSGNDTVDGGDGADVILGGTGSDSITGGKGDDVIDADLSDEPSITGETADDTVNAGDGADSVHGGPGDDVLDGGRHDDLLIGGEGDDSLDGGEGADTLDGGTNSTSDPGDVFDDSTEIDEAFTIDFEQLVIDRAIAILSRSS